MNNKGFTLVELIIVIALLATIALLSTPNIIRVIEKNKVDNYNETLDSIIEATELYVSNNRYELDFKDASGNNASCKPGDPDDKKIYSQITLQKLIDSKNISTLVKNPCTEVEISTTTKIDITLNCKTKQFEYNIKYDTNTNLKKHATYTDEASGKIKEGKKCEDLYP